MGKSDNNSKKGDGDGKEISSTTADPAAKKIQEQLAKLQTAFDDRNKFVTDEMGKLSKLIQDNISTQNAKLKNFEERIESLEKDLQHEKTQNAKRETLIKELSEKLDDNQAHSRRLNLIISGIPEKKSEVISEVIKTFMVYKLKIPLDEYEQFVFRDYHRLGPKGTTTENGDVFRKEEASRDIPRKNPHRAIIIAFTQQFHRNKVLGQAKNLSPESNLSIKPDLTPRLAKERNKLLQIRMNIKAISKSNLANLAYISYKPVLFVKVNGQQVIYNDSIDVEECE